MPRPVRAFACIYGCGRGVLTSKKRMSDHEASCARNPASESCPTCRHNYREDSEPADYASGYPGFSGGLFCAIDRLQYGDVMVIGCMHWEANSPVVLESEESEGE